MNLRNVLSYLVALLGGAPVLKTVRLVEAAIPLPDRREDVGPWLERLSIGGPLRAVVEEGMLRLFDAAEAPANPPAFYNEATPLTEWASLPTEEAADLIEEHLASGAYGAIPPALLPVILNLAVELIKWIASRRKST